LVFSPSSVSVKAKAGWKLVLTINCQIFEKDLRLFERGVSRARAIMSTPSPQKKRSPGIFTSLLLATLVSIPWAIANARPRPVSPPWPSLGSVYYEGFDQPLNFAANQASAAGIWTESWSGYALNRQGAMVTPWVVPMVVSNAFRVEPERGAIRFWYRPDFGSGVGPGQPATLLQLVSANGKTEAVWWTLVVSPAGNEVHLICQTESGPTSCLGAEIKWEAGSWHLLTIGFAPTNSALFVDDHLSAVGEGLTPVPKAVAPYTRLVVGSTLSGQLPAQGQIEELSIFSGRKRLPQVMGNWFGLSADWEIGLYYASLSKVAALGPIPDEELAARKVLAEKLKAEREALGIESEGGGMEMRLMGGPVANCVTNSPLYITNTVAWYATNSLWTVEFEIQGTNSPADVFTTTNLSGNNLTNSYWVWLERGPSCYTYQYTNQAPGQSYYILGTMLDSDSDGLTDAYEKLASKTLINNPDSDGDGLVDGDEVLHETNPHSQDSDGDGEADQAFTVIITRP